MRRRIPNPGVAVGVAVAVGERLAVQPVFVVPGEARRLPVQRLRRQVAVRIVSVGRNGTSHDNTNRHNRYACADLILADCVS